MSSSTSPTPQPTLFERIIAKQIPAKIEHEDDRYIAIHDISPQAPVHLLVIPKRVIPTLNDLRPADAELVGGMFLLARDLMHKLGRRDYRTLFNCGAVENSHCHFTRRHRQRKRPSQHVRVIRIHAASGDATERDCL